ncbi:MAG: hypothetical protein AB1Z21_09930, partial [Synechococcaceae cyanobacterium]
MDQRRNGHGALPLLLRLSMLRARQRGQGSLAERGYALAVALITAFVLLLGVGALASRGQLGFVGQVFQMQNRQARDVAEAAIAEFANAMNQERNRHLLIAGTTDNWDPASWAVQETDFRNICTVFDENLNANVDGAGNPVYTNPDPAAIARFSVGGPRNLNAGDATRQFTVEQVEFLNEDRNAYFDTAAGSFLNYVDPADPTNLVPYGDLYRTGRQRSLIRITVLGTITQNGRTSTARVAREFEVVPKCCERSFGENVFGATNWGRDQEPCGAGLPSGTVPGLIIGLSGAAIGGSNNTKEIVQEDGSLVTEAACWNGTSDPNEPTDLVGTPNSTCADGQMARGGISYLPSEFNFVAPVYNHPSGLNPASPVVSVNSKTDFLYFNPARFSQPYAGVA